MKRIGIFLVALAVAGHPAVGAAQASLGGFIPFVGIGLTDEFVNGDTDLTGTYAIAKKESSLVGNPLTGSGSAYYDIALLDTGANGYILTAEAAGSQGFDINGNGFAGENVQQIGGATGLIVTQINNPLGIFTAGLGDRTAAGSHLTMNPLSLRGQSSVATMSAPNEWELPNILGLPMAAQHAIAIRNDDPQIFELDGRTVRTPQVEFLDLGDGGQQGIIRRTNLKLHPGLSFVTGPAYFPNAFGIISGDSLHENPLSPTVVENGGLFIDIDMSDGSRGFEDKEFLFDTGADLTVVSQLTAARLGFDPVLDTPDFVLEVEGSGGIQGGVPGFYVDTLNIDTVGGSFTLHNVPIAVLDVTNPNDPGNIIDGILGMHLFNGRNLVIDAEPSIGQGGAGPSLYIGDPVTANHAWAATATSANWATGGSWSAASVPSSLGDAQVRNVTGANQTAVVTADSTIYRATIGSANAGTITVTIGPGAVLTTFGEVLVESGGVVHLNGGKLDAQFVNLDGGTFAGSGEVFVGTGPVNGAVRNLAGRIAPGDETDPIGTFAITGDLANTAGGTIAFDLAGTAAGTQHDQISADRYAFLAGTLEVTLANLGGGTFVPTIGNMFTLITASEGVVGEFDATLLPSGYLWDIDYQSHAVVLTMTGLGTLPGDFDGNGMVNGADMTTWQSGFGASPQSYDGGDFLAWQRNYGGTAVAAVPEPAAALLTLAAVAMGAVARRRASKPAAA